MDLRAWREKHGLSRCGFADIIGVPVRDVLGWEALHRGGHELPKWLSLVCVAIDWGACPDVPVEKSHAPVTQSGMSPDERELLLLTADWLYKSVNTIVLGPDAIPYREIVCALIERVRA